MDITTVRGRHALVPRREPYWHRLGKGRHVGYRKTSIDGSGTWIARYTCPQNGRSFNSLGQFQNIRNADSFDAAKRSADSWFESIDQTGSPLQHTIRDACEQYVRNLRNKGAESKTIADIEHRLNRDVLSDLFFASKPLLSLTKSDFDNWRQSLQYKRPGQQTTQIKKASATINRDMTPLRATMNLAFENQWVVRNSWKAALKPISVRQDPTVERSRTDYLTKTERHALASVVEHELSPFLEVLCLIPVRPGALAKLKVHNYDKRQRLLTIASDKANPRSIHVPEVLHQLLVRITRNKLPTAPLICTQDGGHWNKDKWKAPFKQAVKQLKLPETTVMYTVRHSVITDLIAAGVPVLTVAQLAGTSIRMIEKHYGKLLKTEALAALEKLAI